MVPQVYQLGPLGGELPNVAAGLNQKANRRR